MAKANAWGPKNELFTCQCDSMEHMIVLSTWDWRADGESKFFSTPEEDVSLQLEVHLPSWPGFWGRLKNAIRYVFGYKCKYGHFDVVSFKYEDVARLKNAISAYERKLGEYQADDARWKAEQEAKKAETDGNAHQ